MMYNKTLHIVMKESASRPKSQDKPPIDTAKNLIARHILTATLRDTYGDDGWTDKPKGTYPNTDNKQAWQTGA